MQVEDLRTRKTTCVSSVRPGVLVRYNHMWCIVGSPVQDCVNLIAVSTNRIKCVFAATQVEGFPKARIVIV